MILRLGLLMLIVNFVTTSEGLYKEDGLKNSATELDNIYSLWPSVHNGARVMKLRKREVQGQVGPNEGGGTDIKVPDVVAIPLPDGELLPLRADDKQVTNNNDTSENTLNQDQPKANETLKEIPKNETQTKAPGKASVKNNSTATNQLDINNPGVLKRGLIVFSVFALMAVTYYFFFRRSNKKNDAGNTHNTSETNQFRYGVLQSDDRRENMELSRIPLTMDSDDDDEGLEIFDLGQKKKSLSYVNLQTHEDEAINNSIDIDKDVDNLLLDIEDASEDTLINWSKDGNKSIL